MNVRSSDSGRRTPDENRGDTAATEFAQPVLLQTKLAVPAPRLRRVLRARLDRRLQAELTAGAPGTLTLISAPAGFGKTTLVSAWHTGAGRPAGSLAWVSLDEADNDPVRFWAYVAAALETLLSQQGSPLASSVLSRLQSPQPATALLTTLLNELRGLRIDSTLVLDDYHVIDTPAIHEALSFLLDHLPPKLHLVILTRSDPPLPLSRLRARGRLTEIRAADLRFTAEEAAEFLTGVMSLPLPSEAVAALESRTEGWIAGLQFAALAMRGREDLIGFVSAFTGSNRFVVDYLAEEVLDRLPAHLQDFVLRTAILDRMCGSLCDAVMGVGDDGTEAQRDRGAEGAYSQLLLQELERANLFIVPLDDERHWYRYHHLFADVVRERLKAGASGERVATLHRRAARWFERQGLVAEAVHHALQGAEWEQAARLIEASAYGLIFRGQVVTVLGWLKAIPDACMRRRPDLSILYALALGDTNDIAAVEARLQDAERCIDHATSPDQEASIRGNVALIRSMVARSVGDLLGCVAYARQALDLLPDTRARAAAMLNVARGFLQSGDVLPRSERLALEVIEPVRLSGNMFAYLSAYTNLARLQLLQGRLRAASATLDWARQVAPELGGLEAFGSSSASYYFSRAAVDLEWNHLQAAEECLAQGLALVTGPLTVDADVVTLGYLLRARLLRGRGDLNGAAAALVELAELGRRRGFAPHLQTQVAAAQAQVVLAQGDLPAAARWAGAYRGLMERDATPDFVREGADLVYLRVRAAQLKPTAATDARTTGEMVRSLDRLLVAAETLGRTASAIEILILRALVLAGQADVEGSHGALRQALMLAEPEGYVRLFADEGALMAALLVRWLAARGGSPGDERREHGIRAYAERLLHHCSAAGQADGAANGPSSLPVHPHAPGIEPLSSRELEVLRLVAMGKSNAEISGALIIAISTVKTHTNSIFAKLGVASRTAAIARARDAGLV